MLKTPTMLYREAFRLRGSAKAVALTMKVSHSAGYAPDAFPLPQLITSVMHRLGASVTDANRNLSVGKTNRAPPTPEGEAF